MLRIFLFILFIQQMVCECVVEEKWENFLGSKAPYRTVANYTFSKIHYENCEPLKIWALVRHGTRNPNLSLIGKMRTRLPEIRDQILENISHSTEFIHNSDLENFKKWRSKLDDNDEKKLAPEGEQEMLLLAERMQARFPEVLDNIYSPTSFKFKYTKTQRTEKSARYFAAGLFGKATVRDIEFPEPLKRDPILRFYKLCSKWRTEVSKNPKALIEKFRFEKSSIMNETILTINKRLGFKENLDFHDVYSMYLICAFETAWNGKKKSPWCSPFTSNELKVFEYLEDLKHYWRDGYGYELTYKQACPAFGDMLEFFKNENKYPKSAIYFTHSGTLLKMLAHLELFKIGKHLQANNFHEQKNREWKVSRIDSFGTNLVFISFDCKGVRKILTMHQEKILRLPSCPQSDLCDLDIIEDYYKNSTSCAFNKMCDN